MYDHLHMDTGFDRTCDYYNYVTIATHVNSFYLCALQFSVVLLLTFIVAPSTVQSTQCMSSNQSVMDSQRIVNK